MATAPDSLYVLRDYQNLIAETALHTNTLAYLATGMGKTFIAFRLIDHHLQIIRQSREMDKNQWPKVIIFIAPKKALLHQQIDSIQKLCSRAGEKNFAECFDGSKFYNNKHIDLWGSKEWLEMMKQRKILGMTPAILLCLLQKKILPPDVIDLIIFDECHHSIGNDPMALVCDAIKHHKLTPRILGLTASPVSI